MLCVQSPEKDNKTLTTTPSVDLGFPDDDEDQRPEGESSESSCLFVVAVSI